ncbi:MAG TPA: hypothetical protein O0X23_04275 [Methanocorpusculum sp.]|nr:hypothetical protein [Methanocorpusculum sp.]
MIKTLVTLVIIVAIITIAAPQVIPHIGTHVQSCVDVIADATRVVCDYITHAAAGGGAA